MASNPVADKLKHGVPPYQLTSELLSGDRIDADDRGIVELPEGTPGVYAVGAPLHEWRVVDPTVHPPAVIYLEPGGDVDIVADSMPEGTVWGVSHSTGEVLCLGTVDATGRLPVRGLPSGLYRFGRTPHVAELGSQPLTVVPTEESVQVDLPPAKRRTILMVGRVRIARELLAVAPAGSEPSRTYWLEFLRADDEGLLSTVRTPVSINETGVGMYRVDLLSPGRYRCELSQVGWVGYRHVTERTKDLDIDVKYGGTLAVHVESSVTGAPPPDVELQWSMTPPAGGYGVLAAWRAPSVMRSRDAEWYRADVPQGAIMLEVWAPGHLRQRVRIDESGGPDRRVNVVMRPTGSMRVLVLVGGAPGQGEVEIVAEHGEIRGSSSIENVVEFKDLRPGAYKLRVRAADSDWRDSPDEVVVIGGREIEVRVVAR